MPIRFIREDITKMPVSAIVNAANPTLLGGGGVDGAIHRAAGPELLAECRALGGCRTGEAKITAGYRLPCRYVIHTVGPVWAGGEQGEDALLASCYRASLALALEHGCESVAFPLISSGAFGYPKDRALQVALHAVTSFLLEREAIDEQELLVYLVFFDRQSFQISRSLFRQIEQRIDDQYVALYADGPEVQNARMAQAYAKAAPCEAAPAAPARRDRFKKRPAQEAGLAELMMTLDESFAGMLLRKIDERGMTDAQCYKRANVDRRLFSKIRSDMQYRPSKPTAIAFAVALELSLAETRELLEKAGFALSHSNRFDIIIEYFIASGNYSVLEINEALFAFDQPLLGA